MYINIYIALQLYFQYNRKQSVDNDKNNKKLSKIKLIKPELWKIIDNFKECKIRGTSLGQTNETWKFLVTSKLQYYACVIAIIGIILIILFDIIDDEYTGAK